MPAQILGPAICAKADGGFSRGGDIAEVLLYSRLWDSNDRNQFAAYAAARYGL
jgi:hypothetical protein